MLDASQRDWYHVCPMGHAFHTFGDFNPQAVVFTYASATDALCPVVNTRGETCAALASVRLKQDPTVIVRSYGRCRARWLDTDGRSHSCGRDIYARMVPLPELATTMERMQGFTYWRVQVPYPIYCEACAESRVVSRSRQTW